MDWRAAQEWEKSWHGNCVNKVAGEMHQVQVIAPKMGLVRVRSVKRTPVFDLEGKSVLDIGGGASSLLLKCINVRGKVVDPIQFPGWVYARYDCAGIDWEIGRGEDIDEAGYDEVWIYNCLQHSENPKKIIDNARKAGKLIRIYEYIDVPVCPGHIHTLREVDLNRWLGGEGKVDGKRYYGIFPANINTSRYWDKIYRVEGKDTWRVKDAVNDYVLGKIEGSVLELGCGVGVLARRIEGQYLGLDISPVAIGIMRDQGFDAEVRSIPPIGTDKFDTIVGLEILEHIDDRSAVVYEASQLCRQAIFSVPNDCMPPEEVPEHRVVLDGNSFEQLLREGFQDVQIVTVGEYLVGVCQ